MRRLFSARIPPADIPISAFASLSLMTIRIKWTSGKLTGAYRSAGCWATLEETLENRTMKIGRFSIQNIQQLISNTQFNCMGFRFFQFLEITHFKVLTMTWVFLFLFHQQYYKNTMPAAWTMQTTRLGCGAEPAQGFRISIEVLFWNGVSATFLTPPLQCVSNYSLFFHFH